MDDSAGPDDSILFDFVELYRAEASSKRDRSLSWYLERFPGHEELVAREYLSLAGEARRPARGLDETTRRLGKYEIVRELGRGGQGTVYLARDVELDRNVAVKVLEGAFGAISEERKSRLRREALAISKLDHPAICVVYEADLEAKYPFLALRYVEGRSLASLIADGAAPTRPASRAELHAALLVFERVARALHVAHEAGVVHRDIKPGNLVLDGRGHPVILDFGLALDDGVDPGLTRATALMGTPSFLSPEQLDDPRGVTRATDVYSLGVTMFEVLTGRRPFEEPTLERLCEAIRSAPTPSPRSANPDLPEEVRVVLETAMAKEPSERYASAQDLAEDLRRIRAYEPIAARRAGVALRARRWFQRNSVIATASLAVFVALVAGLFVSLSSLSEVRAQTSAAAAARDRAYAGFLRDESTASLPGRPKRALLLAMEAARAEPGLGSNRALLGALERYYLRTLSGCRHGALTGLVLSPDGRWIACADKQKGVRVWDPATAEPLPCAAAGVVGVVSLAASPDGDALALGSADGAVAVYAVGAGSAPLELEGHRARVGALRFTADGRGLVTCSADGTGVIWDLETGAARLAVEHGSRVRSAYLTDDGSTLVTASGEMFPIEDDARLLVWDANTGVLRHTLVHPSDVRSSALDPSGERVVAVSRDGRVRAWSLADGAVLWDLELEAEGYLAAFSHDGAKLAIGHGVGAEVHDAGTGELLYRLEGHEDRPVCTIEFAPGDARIATGSYDQSVRLWDAGTGRLQRTMWAEGAYVYHVRWAPDGDWIVSGQLNGPCFVWYVRRPFLTRLTGHGDAVHTARFDSAGERVVTASADGTARVWDTYGRERQRLAGHAGPVASAEFDREGTRVLTASTDGTARLWSAADGTPLATLQGHAGALVLACFDASGERVLTASEDGTARLFRAETGEATAVLDGHAGPLREATFSPDGSLVATCASDRTAVLWDAASGEVLWRLDDFEVTHGDQDSVFDVEFGPDGRWLAVAGEDGAVRLVDTTALDARPRTRAIGAPGFVAFHPGGERLVIAGMWRPWIQCASVPELETTWDAREHRSRLTRVAVSSSGEHVLTAAVDRSARLWDAATGACLVLYPHRRPVLDASFSPDGRLVVTACKDGIARIWPVDLMDVAERHSRGDIDLFGGLPSPGGDP